MIYYLITFIIITCVYLGVSIYKKNFFNIVFFPYLYQGLIMVLLYTISLGIQGVYTNVGLGDVYLILFFLLEFIGIGMIELFAKPLKLPTIRCKELNKKIPYFLIFIVVGYFLINFDLIKLAISNPRMFYANTRIGGGVIYYILVPILKLLYYIYISNIDYTKRFGLLKAIIATGVIFIFLYIFGQKAALLSIGIILLVTIYYKSTNKTKILSTIFKLGVVLVVALLGVFVLYSKQQNISMQNVLMGITTYSDYLSNFNKLVDNFDGFGFGKYFIQDEFLGFIPRAIWSNKPTLYGSLSLGLHVPELVEWTKALTGAPSFGPLGQGYADFGVFGIFTTAAIQWIFAYIAKTYENRLNNEYNFFNHFMFLTFTGVWIFSLPLTTIPFYQLGVIFIFILVSTSHKKRGKMYENINQRNNTI